jgi:hypothetical protein
MRFSRSIRLNAERWLVACVSLVSATGGISCGTAAPAKSEPKLATATPSPASDSRLMTKDQVQAKRLARQDQHFRDFDECPPCFVNKNRGLERIFLFDGVVDCNTTLRIGTWGDGGKWLCDPEKLPTSTVVYSFGVGDEVSFDHEMAGTFGAEVHMFDPSPSVKRRYGAFESGKAQGRGRVFFHPLGLGPVSAEKGKEWTLTIEGQSCPAKGLVDIAKSLGHARVDILKIDIEGGEFAALEQILSDNLLATLQVQQLLIEFHLWAEDSFERFVRIVHRFAEQGFFLFRKELNPTDASRCAEFAFVRVASQNLPAGQ